MLPKTSNVAEDLEYESRNYCVCIALCDTVLSVVLFGG